MATFLQRLARLKALKWHHHMIRGAIVAHVANAGVTAKTEWNADGAIDVLCLVFVITEYAIQDKEMTRAEREKAAADAAKQVLAAIQEKTKYVTFGTPS